MKTLEHDCSKKTPDALRETANITSPKSDKYYFTHNDDERGKGGVEERVGVPLKGRPE